MSYLVDANVLCEATRPNAAPRVLAWLAANDDAILVSAITIGEILKGIRLLPSGRRRSQLERWFQDLGHSLEGRVLPVDGEVMASWTDLYARHQKAGRLLASFDSLLAATAQHHRLTLVTRNTADFPSDIQLVNPWEG